MKEATIYTSVCIPKEIAREIDNLIKGKGYRSRSEFINYATRKELDQIRAREEEETRRNEVIGGY